MMRRVFMGGGEGLSGKLETFFFRLNVRPHKMSE
jgi:hypothetical protein